MYKIAHFSDPHLGPLPAVRLGQLTGKRMFGYLNWVAGRKRVHQRGVLDALIKDLRRQRVDHVALTGDLVNISLAEEFNQASDWLATIGEPEDVTVVPGNHDAYVPMPNGTGHEKWSAYMASNRAGGAFVKSNALRFPFVRKLGDIALVGLSSAIPTWPLLASGQLGSEQLSALPDLLRSLGEKGLFRVLLIHHPPLPGLTSPRRALSDAHLLRDTLASCGAELVLYGHNHTQAIDMLEGEHAPIPVVGVPSASVSTPKPWPLARYNCFRIGKRGTRWTCQMIGRGLAEPQGKFEKLEHIWLKA